MHNFSQFGGIFINFFLIIPALNYRRYTEFLLLFRYQFNSSLPIIFIPLGQNRQPVICHNLFILKQVFDQVLLATGNCGQSYGILHFGNSILTATPEFFFELFPVIFNCARMFVINNQSFFLHVFVRNCQVQNITK